MLTTGVPRFVLPLVSGHGQPGGAHRLRLRCAPFDPGTAILNAPDRMQCQAEALSEVANTIYSTDAQARCGPENEVRLIRHPR